MLLEISYKKLWTELLDCSELEISYKKLWTELLDCSELGISYKNFLKNFLKKNFLMKEVWVEAGKYCI